MKIKSVIPDLSDTLGHDSEARFASELKRQSEEFEGDPDWLYAWYLASTPRPFKKFTKNIPYIAKNRKYRVFGRFGDTHHQLMSVIRWLNKMEIDLLFFAYYDSRYWQYLKAKPVWLPWSYDPSYFYPSDEEPVYDVAFLGTVSDAYPLREAIDKKLSILSERYGWRTLHRAWTSSLVSFKWYLDHGLLDIITDRAQRYLLYGQWHSLLPFIKRQLIRRPSEKRGKPAPWLGQVSQLKKDPGYIVGERYAEVLRSTRVFMFGTSVYKHPIKRLFFGLGSGTCVLMDTPHCAKRLGLKDGENYVAIDKDNWSKKLKWILDHEDERRRIAQNGLWLAQERHTHQVRAKELIKVLENYEAIKR